MSLKLTVRGLTFDQYRWSESKRAGAGLRIKGKTLPEWRRESERLGIPVDDLMQMDELELARLQLAKLDEVVLQRRREKSVNRSAPHFADTEVAKPTSQ